MESEETFTCEKLSSEKIEHDMSFKLVLIGNTSVGKSSITTQAIQNYYNENYRATIGFEFFVMNYKIDKKVVKLQIWDTCGQEIYRSIVANFYRSSSLALLVYSIEEESFEEMGSWLTELRMYSSPDINIFLVGNKSDLEENRQITYEEGLKFQMDNKIDNFIETSAKTGNNTSEVFRKCAILLYEESLKYKDMYSSSNMSSSNTEKSVSSFKLSKRGLDTVYLETKESEHIKEEKKIKNDGCIC